MSWISPSQREQKEPSANILQARQRNSMRMMAHWQQNFYSSHFRARMPQPLNTSGLNIAHVACRLRCSLST